MEEEAQAMTEEWKKVERRENIIRRGRGRTNSTTLLEIWTNNLKSEKEEKRKRSRQEKEDLARDIFKRCNKIDRTPPKLRVEKRRVIIEEGKMEVEKIDESTNRLILEKIRENMRREMKEEIKRLQSKMTEMEKRWMAREKELVDSLRKIEETLKDMDMKRLSVEEEKMKQRRN